MNTVPAEPCHAAPLTAVDRVWTGPDGDGWFVRAAKLIRADDPYLSDHFPGHPVYPGVFVLESVCQAVRQALGGRGGEPPDLVGVRSLRLLSVLRPGALLSVSARIARPDSTGTLSVSARCAQGDGADVARFALEFQWPGGGDA